MRTLDHVAIVVRDIEAALPLYRDVFGFTHTRTEDVPSQKVRVAFLETGQSRIELTEPTADDSPVSRTLNFIGYSWADRGERLDEAEGLIRRALELRPGDGYITDSLGWLFYQRGLQRLEDGRDRDAREAFSSAVRELERAVELTKPGDPVITRHLADAYRSVSRFSDAIATYRQSLELDPSEEDLLEIHRQIELLVLQSAPPGAAR